ncbi:hypothetical protein CEXT_733651 [Caerostris extrusa]|uniref:PLC-beta PH domain-containing protein n=1 Tax=Caerostris extrusa TaxID=172846 RepID=A0AAV4U1M9_CAEEX|nr:hypothetical protein CEXT_733651 [Caerostris extrusa]
MGTPDTPLEDKQVTVVYGPELVNVNTLHFSCNCKETAQKRTEAVHGDLLKTHYFPEGLPPTYKSMYEINNFYYGSYPTCLHKFYLKEDSNMRTCRKPITSSPYVLLPLSSSSKLDLASTCYFEY